MLCPCTPGSLMNTGTLHSMSPSAPQKYLITKSSMKECQKRRLNMRFTCLMSVK